MIEKVLLVILTLGIATGVIAAGPGYGGGGIQETTMPGKDGSGTQQPAMPGEGGSGTQQPTRLGEDGSGQQKTGSGKMQIQSKDVCRTLKCMRPYLSNKNVPDECKYCSR